ncbi:hypothetical protein ACHAW5_004076 [Stephanodiscus triporus]|uniref:FHA domain-containing protein n=1 Tax=Stephanodiscus triporus TaxID=2934178 RepID=A0ABD3PYC8_9STRA
MSWTRPPQHAWSLDELKQGNIVATHSINDIIKNHFESRSNENDHLGVTFGRIADDPSLVDIVTSHESCSRRHARIAFDRDGTPWLRDLGSGNGTFVNERRLPPEACGKDDASSGANINANSNRKGSRGVVLYPGDAIRFGASTRLYILEGPEEFERDAIELKRKMNAAAAAATQAEIATQKSDRETPPNHDAGCSWGMADDPSATDQEQRFQIEDERTPLPSMDSFFYPQVPGKLKIPTALLHLHSQYNTKMHKLQSIQTESQRILQKENMGMELTDGQRGQLAKNDTRIVELEKDVANLKDKIEDGMYSVIHPGKDRRKRPIEKDQNIDDDGDDFYDRTATSKRQRKDDAAESEGSLIQKWKSLLEELEKQQLLVTRALERCARLQKQIDNSAVDDDDVFFLQNDLALANDNLSKASRCSEETEKELDDVEFLLKIVNAKLAWDRKEGLIGTNIQKKEGTTGWLAQKTPDSAPHTNNEQDNNTQRVTSLNPFESKKDEWKAPSGQDGSGRTALHEKFKGRY